MSIINYLYVDTDGEVLEIGIKLGWYNFWFNEYYPDNEFWFDDEDMICNLDRCIELYLKYEGIVSLLDFTITTSSDFNITGNKKTANVIEWLGRS